MSGVRWLIESMAMTGMIDSRELLRVMRAA